MKRKIAFVILLVELAALLSAAGIRMNRPINQILQTQQISLCCMTNSINLASEDKQCQKLDLDQYTALFQGCEVLAAGSPYTQEACLYLAFNKYRAYCDLIDRRDQR